MGEKAVRKGPLALVPQYNEKLEKVSSAYILGSDQALELESQRNHNGKQAGFKWQVKGSCVYVPGKYETVVRKIKGILINENEGIYVINSETSEKKK